MDFLPQLANQNNVFLEKAKKHAKRLLKLAKNNNNQLNIDNLSQAQEVLAQLNGYDSWHSMIGSINTKIEKERIKPYQYHAINKDNFITLHEDENKNLEHCSKFPYFTENEFMYSFLSLELSSYYAENISITNNDFEDAIYRLISYLKNEKYHSQFMLLFENKPLTTDLYSWQQQIDLAVHCGLSIKDSELLFETQYPTDIKTALSTIIVIKTPLTQKNIHNSIVQNIINLYEHNFIIKVKETIEQEFIEITTRQKTIKYPCVYKYLHTSWFKNLFSPPNIQETNVIDFITKVSTGIPQWAGVLDLSTINLTVFHNKTSTDTLDNIYFNIHHEKGNYYHNYDINLNIGVNKIGIPFIHSVNNRVNCYQPNIDFNPTVFIGTNELRDTMSNYINYCTILNRYKKYEVMPHGFFIHNGSNKGLYNLLQKTFHNSAHVTNIVNKKINLHTDFINIFDLPLNNSIVEDYDPTYNQLVKICFNLKNIKEGTHLNLENNIYHFICKIKEDLYQFNYKYQKKYTHCVSHIANILPLELINHSWFELSEYFLKNKQYYEAQICHNQAMPVLKDLISIIKNNQKDYQAILPEINITNIVSNIDQFIVEHPYYNEPTNIYFDTNCLYFLDLNHLESNDLLFHCLIKKIYNINKLKSINRNYNSGSLILNIADFDLNCSQEIETLIFLMRESKKWYINMSLTSDTICYELAAFAQTKIVTSQLTPEQEKDIDLKNNKFNKVLDYNEFIIDTYRTKNNINGNYKLVLSDELYDILSDNIANQI